MALALFDLDNTLLAGDSDYLWGCFLVEHSIVDGESYESENQRFYDQYLAGSLDIHEFLRFQLRPLALHKREQLEQWREQYLAEKIDPVLLPAARELLDKHRAQGDELLIITATAKRLDMPMDRVYVNVQEYGNTSSASIPIAMDEAIQVGRLKPGDRCLIVAFGGGFTWGSALLQF